MLFCGAKNVVFVLLAAASAQAQFTAAPGSPVAVGATPRSVAAADFNGDGKPDLVTANFTSNNVTVLLGNGSGGFAAATGGPFAVGTNPQSVAVADFNGDGNPDLVTANLSGDNVTVLLGNGSGGFTAATSSPIAVGAGPIFVAVGDFNGDGNADIVAANSSENTITVLLGDGMGGFTAALGSPFAVGANPGSVAAADFNGDGNLDIVTANSGDNTVTVLLGNGTGGFTGAPGSPFAVGVNPASVAAGDFNGDGDLDIVSANSGDNTITVLLGDGTAGFTGAPGSPFAVGVNPASVAVRDFNGDGNLDVVTANAGDNTVTELAGDGTGGFVPATGSPFVVGSNPAGAAVGDFNLDGKADLAIANLSDSTVTVMLNSLPAIAANPASLTFYAEAGQAAPAAIPVSLTAATGGSTYHSSTNQPWLAPTPTSHATGGVSTVDLSASAASLAAGVYTGTIRYIAPGFFEAATAVTFRVANPSGTLQAAAGSPFAVGGEPQSVALADFNGDGSPDLVAANSGDNTVTVLLGDGAGGFTAGAGSPFAVGLSPDSAAVGDFNGDGKPDVVTANSGDNTLTVLLGDGLGGFTPAAGSPFAVGLKPQSVAVADFNGDGRPDIVSVNNGDNNVTVLLSDGAGGFTTAPGSPFPVGLFPQAVAVGDFNGDGKPDIVTANSGNNTVKVILGNGAGGFTGGGAFAVGSFPQAVAVADLNGDGKLDIVTANSGGNTVTVLLGNGAGGFTAATGSPLAVGTSPQSVAVADINGDGKPDIVTANTGSNTITVLLGNGAGGFAVATGSPFAAGTNPISVAAADFNGDGMPDIAIANLGDSAVAVLLGAQAATSSVLSTTAGATVPYGTSVPLTLAVTGGFVASPAGAGEFLDGGVSIGTAIQTASPYTFAAIGLAAGVHTLTAAYSGDPASAASNSNTVMVTVTPTSQTITFGALSNQALGTVTVTVSATASSGLAVSFTSTTLPVCTVSGTTVTLLAGGTCTIQATQAGNSNFAAAPAVSQHFSVTAASQTITFAALPNQPLGTAPFTVSATATSGLAVNFASTTTPVCTVSGSTVTLVSGGTCTIQATQPGNSNFAAAPSVSQHFSVTAGTQSITFGALADRALGTATFTLSATASSGLTVVFTSATLPVCTVTTVTVKMLTAGTCTIQAAQAGNSSYAAATPVIQSFTVTQGTQTVTFAAPPSKAFGAVPFTVSATASSGLAVSFASNTPPVCTVSGATVTLVSTGSCTVEASQAGNANYAAATPVDQSFTVTQGSQTLTFGALPNQANGAAPFTLSATASSGLAVSFASTSLPVCTVSGTTVTLLSTGTCTIQATQAGNSNFAAAPAVSQHFSVTAASQTIAFSALSNEVFGTAPFTVSATASSGLAVAFTSTTLPVCTVSGATVTLVTVGVCTIQASQAGNSSYAAAPSVSQKFSVTAAAQTITFGTLPDVTAGAAPFAVTATASSGLTVSFTSATLPVCTVASATVKVLISGTCTIEASQTGNSSYAAAVPVIQAFNVNPEAQSITFAAPPNKVFGTAPFTVSATASSGLAVSFASNTLPVCTVSGAMVTMVSGGTCTIAASQPGNSTYAAATAVDQSFAVAPGSQTITFGPLSNKPFGTAPVTVSATTSSGLAVSFTSTTPGVCTVSGATVTLLSAGTCIIQAAQAGNSNFGAATAVTQQFSVTAASQTIAFSALQNQAFGTAPFTVSATASSGLPVAFTSTILPVCTVSGAMVTVVSVGTCTIQASQAGNSSYAAAPSVSQKFTVTPAAQTITFGALPDVTAGAAPFPVTATASSGLTVSFTSTTASVCTVASATVKVLISGTCTIQAAQTGNSSYAAALAVSQTFSVNPEFQSITFAAIPSKAFGAAPFTVSATSSAGLTVIFTSTTSSVCTVAVATVTLVSVGNCTIEAAQAGNSTYAPATPVEQTVSATQAGQTITFGTLPDKPLGTAPITISATASSGLPVTFASNSGVCSVSGTTITLLIGGTCTIQASQPGNANYTPATAIAQSFTVTPASQTITFGALSNQTLGAGPVTLSATASSGLAVSFASTTPSVCTASDATVTLLGAGICTIQAAQAGSSSYAAAPSVSQQFTVRQGNQTITFGALSGEALGAGSQVALNATASSGLAVTFASTTLPICTVSGATLTLLMPGTCTIHATQAGNTSYAAATPVTQTLTVTAGVLTIGAVLNAGSYAAIPIAADGYTVAFGTDFSTTAAQTPSLTLPTTLAGATVAIADSNGETLTAPLFYVSPTQINFLVPEGLANGSATVTVTNPGGKKTSFNTTVAQVSPALFTADSSGKGVPAAIALAYAGGVSSGTGQQLPVFNCGGSPLACTATPIDLGPSSTSVYLELYGTGIRGRSDLSGVSVTLGGTSLQVGYAGAQGTYSGLDQVNVLLDRSLMGAGMLTLQLTVDGVPANPVTVSIE